MRRDHDNKLAASPAAAADEADDAYFTYRPLSNLPTPPPSSRASSSADQWPTTALDDGEPLTAQFRGPAIHLVNLIPSSASLATASIPLVQAILCRANQPIETIALAVCVLDSLATKFARNWRLSCPLHTGGQPPFSGSKRHTLPPSLLLGPQQPQLHIDSVSPELIILAALVIATKFVEDPQEPTEFYCRVWGRHLWSHQQLNVTERCIMESLGYRIMPLYTDDCLTDAMVDMQLAVRHDGRFPARQPDTPPATGLGSDDFVPTHSRSKTMSTGKATMGLGLSITPVETPAAETPNTATPRATERSIGYFDKAAY